MRQSVRPAMWLPPSEMVKRKASPVKAIVGTCQSSESPGGRRLATIEYCSSPLGVMGSSSLTDTSIQSNRRTPETPDTGSDANDLKLRNARINQFRRVATKSGISRLVLVWYVA